ncbi:hypothetical protein ACFFU9_12380 [Mariniflexile ostreae]|uniref:Lipoprotein n=1 Tax=Mariniflexile ostreae TaxID=1520892 RepID=A0ABV5FDJ4_9FLAO
MKTNAIHKISVLVIFTVCLLVSCNNVTKEKPSEQQKPEKISAPKQTIDYEYASNLEEEYINTRASIINKSLDMEDAREFWFDLDQLKKYIAYVEQEAKSQGYKNLGIRIYNGAYPKEKQYPDPGYSTVFLVPTGTKSISKAGISSSSFILSNDNIQSIRAYNYGHAGRPPKKIIK